MLMNEKKFCRHHRATATPLSQEALAAQRRASKDGHKRSRLTAIGALAGSLRFQQAGVWRRLPSSVWRDCIKENAYINIPSMKSVLKLPCSDVLVTP